MGLTLPDDRILVYLADLTHLGVRVATEAFPLNVGLIAGYAKRQFGDVVDVLLFKYPDKLFAALKERPPDVLGCSNYVWNCNLSTWACTFAKARTQRVLTVFGGTNYPFDMEGQREFLRARPCVDVHVFYEGEVAFAELLRRFLDTRDIARLKTAPIPGCQYLTPDGALVSGGPVERMQALDTIPSPYVSGLMDEFFDGRLTPMIETTRGCPFSCNFCNAGDRYFSRVNKFSLDYVREELEYIAPRAAALGLTNLTLADNNFGMLVRDVEVANAFHGVQERFGWPRQILAWTGKNSKERVIKATEILGPSLSINMAVQSLDPTTLSNIKRSNISVEAYQAINRALEREGRPQEAELIVPLPGETLDSYVHGLRQVMDANVTKVTSYTLQFLYGTDYKNPAYRARHGYSGKWRIVPLDFGEYEGRKVFDVEEVAVSSGSMSFDDYLVVRSLALITELSYNNQMFQELMRYLNQRGRSRFDWIEQIRRSLPFAPPSIQRLHESFLQETRAELWDSEEELVAFYTQPDNYDRLVRGEAGGNVIFKHKALTITQYLPDWVSFVTDVARDLVREKRDTDESLEAELATLRRFVLARLAGVLDAGAQTEDVVMAADYDVLRWMADVSEAPLSAFRTRPPVRYRFFFDEAQLREREDQFLRYGPDLPGLFRILARTPTLQRLFRHARVDAS